jgi:hypothetical protein
MRHPLFRHDLPACFKYGSKWQSGPDLAYSHSGLLTGNRSYRGIFVPIFSDAVYTVLKTEITDFTARKTGLIIPFWMADRREDGLEYAQSKGRPVVHSGFFMDPWFFRPAHKDTSEYY